MHSLHYIFDPSIEIEKILTYNKLLCKCLNIFFSKKKITYLTGFLTTKAVVVGGSIA